jgi:hypothetical protein
MHTNRRISSFKAPNIHIVCANAPAAFISCRSLVGPVDVAAARVVVLTDGMAAYTISSVVGAMATAAIGCCASNLDPSAGGQLLKAVVDLYMRWLAQNWP